MAVEAMFSQMREREMMRSMHVVCSFSFALVLAAFAASSVAAPVTISYELTSLGGERWRYDYDVTNMSLDEPVREFTIWFDFTLCRDLVLATPNPPAADWGELVVQPWPLLEDDGFYDALAGGSGIGPGEHVRGFAVEFDWLGSGIPGPQSYDIVDPVTFETRYFDFTIPEPASLLLLAGGFILVQRRGRERRCLHA